jgi:hypothetical protein
MIFTPFSYRQQATIVRENLQFYIDAGITASYPGTGTNWFDISGNGRNSSIVNGPIWTSTGGGYFTFDGVNDYIGDLSTGSIFTGGNLTYNAVIRYESKGEYHNIFDQFNSKPPMLWVRPDNKLEANTDLGIISPLTYTNTIIMVTMTHSTTSGEGLKLYVNGTRIGNNTAAQAAIDTNGRFNLCRRESTGQTYKGRIYNVMFYNRILNPTEITRNYEAFKWRYGI